MGILTWDVLCCWDPRRPMYHWEAAPLPQAVEETMQVGGARPSCSVIFQGMERLVQSSTPACTVQDMDHHEDHAWS